jgi:pilus assembly protein Flp/PilA
MLVAVPESEMRHRLSTLLMDEKGATAIEYGLIVSLVVLAILGALGSVADITVRMWGNVSDDVTAASHPGGH